MHQSQALNISQPITGWHITVCERVEAADRPVLQLGRVGAVGGAPVEVVTGGVGILSLPSWKAIIGAI